MQDPGCLPAPDDTGSATEERFTYQAQAALRGVLEMLAGGGVVHVTCEHFEDVLVARADGAVTGDVVLWDFQQIKSREKQDSWTLSKVLRSKALASLLRTHRALHEHRDLPYVLTVGVEGPLSAEADVRAVAQGRGGDSTERLDRIARHLDADAAETAEFLRLVRIEELPTVMSWSAATAMCSSLWPRICGSGKSRRCTRISSTGSGSRWAGAWDRTGRRW